MIDLHTHTLLSDGELLPAELIRRADVIGYRALGITDHVDQSNIDHVLPRIIKVCKELSSKVKTKLIPGVEITHIPPEDFKKLVKYARDNGACIIVAHGETIVEPVKPGTNRAAIKAGVDILAHPGIITREEAQLARENGVYLEITSRNGHCYSNGHVAKLALNTGSKLVINTDTHSPENLITREKADSIAQSAGLSPQDIESVVLAGTEILLEKALERFKRISAS